MERRRWTTGVQDRSMGVHTEGNDVGKITLRVLAGSLGSASQQKSPPLPKLSWLSWL